MGSESSSSSLGTIIEARKECVISPTGDCLTIYRSCHFLKPLVTSVKESASLPVSSKPIVEVQELPLKVVFKGRRYPQKNWKKWVDHLHPKYHTIWKKAGIEEAIIGSTYQTLRHNELVLEFADKWSPKTNAFIFPWGEATITLEDMMVLGGFSVLGRSIFSALENNEMLEIRDALIESQKRISTANSPLCTHTAWMEHFMGTGDQLEHAAFLSLWLSRYVFPANLYETVGRDLFPMAIHLSKGTRIALAPAVLANIYNDLSLLKQKIARARSKMDDDGGGKVTLLNLWAPFQLVQLWIWERFPTLRPKPNLIKPSEPRVARWHNIHKLKVHQERLAIDSAGDCFQWRPYAAALGNQLSPPKFYGDRAKWVAVGPDVDEDLESFARCIRSSELAGLDCISQYLPHRVAMQFGFDQDIPGCVPRSNKSFDIAWNNYNRPIGDTKLYIPARLMESDVSKRYMEWWKQSMLIQRDSFKSNVVKKRKRSPISLPRILKPERESGNVIRQSKLPYSKVSVEKHDNAIVREGRMVKNISLSAMSQREALGGQSKVARKDASGSEAKRPISNAVEIDRCGGKGSDRGAIRISKLQLEARIREVEKELAQLKAEYAYRFVKNNRTKNPSDA